LFNNKVTIDQQSFNNRLTIFQKAVNNFQQSINNPSTIA